MSKLPDTGTTIFTIMSQLAHEHNAINLSQGFPDFSAPKALLERVTEHMLVGHNQYAPMSGIPELRQQIAAKAKRIYQHEVDPDTEVTVSSGATEALFSAIQAHVFPGDEVIIFDPAYDSYDPAIRLAGGTPVHIPLSTPKYGIDWNRVDAAISDRTSMLILNSPHNPTGAVIRRADCEALINIVASTRITILSDEVYEHIIFDQQRHESMLRYPELAARSLVVSSFGKTYHTTGWKIGYCIAPDNLMTEFRKVHQFNQFCVATPMQYALADFMTENPDYCAELGAFYEQKRDFFCQLLQGSRFSLAPSAGTYFQLAEYSNISNEHDTAFARRLTMEQGIAAIPVSVFYAEPPEQNVLRFCFAKNDDTLERAAEILCRI